MLPAHSLQMIVQKRKRILINERRLASGVTHLTDLAQFRVALNPEDIASGRKLFEDLADAGISVGCLNLSESNAMFAVLPMMWNIQIKF